MDVAKLGFFMYVAVNSPGSGANRNGRDGARIPLMTMMRWESKHAGPSTSVAPTATLEMRTVGVVGCPVQADRSPFGVSGHDPCGKKAGGR